MRLVIFKPAICKKKRSLDEMCTSNLSRRILKIREKNY